MVVAVKIPSCLHQNFFRCDVDLPVVSLDFVPKLGYPLRVEELFVDSRCDLPLLEHVVSIIVKLRLIFLSS